MPPSIFDSDPPPEYDIDGFIIEDDNDEDPPIFYPLTGFDLSILKKYVKEPDYEG
jgi:hypothetical protein